MPASSANLVTVAQALHWFDIPAFCDEATRVLAPGGVLAAWSYAHCHTDSACDEVIHTVFDSLSDFWPPERMIVESRYEDIELPLTPIVSPEFEMTAEWRVEDILGYFRTWSATQRFVRERKSDPIDSHAEALTTVWGEGVRKVRWPITLKVGRK